MQSKKISRSVFIGCALGFGVAGVVGVEGIEGVD
jgi:hypothetical protein